MVSIESHRELDKLVIHEQNGGSIRRNDHAGGCVLGVVLLPAGPGLVRDGRIGCIDRAADRGMPGLGIVVYEGRLRAGVIILLELVDDGIVDRGALPLGIDRGFAFDRDGIARRLGAILVQIPAGEGVAVTGGTGVPSGESHGGAVGHGGAAHIAAALGVIGEGEVLAGVLDDQLLTFRPGDVIAFGELQHRKVKGLDGGGDVAVQNAVYMLPGIRDLGIAAAGEILQLVDEIVFRGVLNVLDPDGVCLVLVEVRFLKPNGRRFRIIDGGAGDLVGIGLSGGGRGDGIGQLVSLHLHEVNVEDNLSAVIVQIVVFRGDVVYIDGAELSNGNDVAIDDRISGDFRVGALNDPLLKDLAGHEGVLGHGADGFAGIAEILRQALGFSAVIVHNDEVDIILIGKLCRQREVAGDALATSIFRFTNIPADEVLALDNGCCR